MTVIKTMELVTTNLSQADRPQQRTNLMMTKKSALKYLRRVLVDWTDLDFMQLTRGGVHKTDPETGETIRVQLSEVHIDPTKRQQMTFTPEGRAVLKNVEEL